MKPFSFSGAIPASKSMMNRALLLQTYQPQLQISGDSNCDDVRHMKSAIVSFIQKKDLVCGDAGTVLRFMGLRVSREKGSFRILGSPRLLRRPQEDLVFILNQLSVQCQLTPAAIVIQSEGWKKPLIPLRVHRETSSQFASGLILNSWELPFDLEFEMRSGVSEGYLQMSLKMAEQAGMKIEKNGNFWRIPAGQKPQRNEMKMEPDYSSAFAVAAAAVLAGEATLLNATSSSDQPDFQFIALLKKMGVSIEQNSSELKIFKASELKAIEANLQSCPDLFPVLAVLCAFAKGESSLRGAPHLVHKESDRIQKTAELLQRAGFIASVKPDGLHITGHGQEFRTKSFSFDPDQDHRMAMAAGLLRLKGFEVQIQNPQVVTKSYPEFWQILGGKT